MRSERAYWVFTVTADQMDKLHGFEGSDAPPKGKIRAKCPDQVRHDAAVC
jgi:hypothetical protein